MGGSVEIITASHLPDNKWLPIKLEGFSVWYGTALFAFEGIVTAQYVFDDMKIPHGQEASFKPVLGVSYLVSCFVFAFAGMYGYLAYGYDIDDVFYLNFPDTCRNVASVILILVLLQSFMLQVYPVFSFLEDSILGVKPDDALCGDAEIEDDDRSNASENEDEESLTESRWGQLAFCKAGAICIIRFVTVFLINFAATVISNVAKMTGLTGSVFMSLVAFILPAVFHIKVKGFNLTVLEWILDIVLFVCGVVGMVLGLIEASS